MMSGDIIEFYLDGLIHRAEITDIEIETDVKTLKIKIFSSRDIDD